MNSVALSGNIGRDPEVRATQSGTIILSFSLAVNERVKRGDAWEDYVNWIDVCMFGRRAESLGNILKGGMKVCVSGRLRYSTWEREGQKRSKIEVIADDVDIMQRRDNSQTQPNGSYAPQSQQQPNYTQQQQYAPQNGYQQPTGGYQQYNQPQQTGGYGNVQMPDVYESDMPFGG